MPPPVAVAEAGAAADAGAGDPRAAAPGLSPGVGLPDDTLIETAGTTCIAGSTTLIEVPYEVFINKHSKGPSQTQAGYFVLSEGAQTHGVVSRSCLVTHD